MEEAQTCRHKLDTTLTEASSRAQTKTRGYLLLHVYIPAPDHLPELHLHQLVWLQVQCMAPTGDKLQLQQSTLIRPLWLHPDYQRPSLESDTYWKTDHLLADPRVCLCSDPLIYSKELSGFMSSPATTFLATPFNHLGHMA